MAVPAIDEKWSGQVTEVVLGATESDGGTRSQTISIGGAKGFPYMGDLASMGHRPRIVMDVMDMQRPASPLVNYGPSPTSGLA